MNRWSEAIMATCQGRFFGEGRSDVASDWAKVLWEAQVAAHPARTIESYFARHDLSDADVTERVDVLLGILYMPGMDE